MERDEIVFEDLHGTPELESVVVDLDIEDAGKGITRVADDKPEEKRPRQADLYEDLPEPEVEIEDRKVAADEDAEEGDDNYSVNVRKRIERERRQKLKAREEADYWKGQAEAANAQLSETRKSVTKETVEAINAQITQAETELETALEDGKSAEQVKLMGRITDLKAKKILTETQADNDTSSDNREDGGRVRRSGVPSKRTLANDWMERQSDWYGKPGFERQSRIANRLDKEIFAEGYDVNDPEYFKELDRRLRKAAPDVFDDVGDRDTSRGSRRSPVAPVDRAGSERNPRAPGKVQLTQDDFANMRNFGLDPNSPEHLKEYAANKREADTQERQRTGGRS